MKRILWTILITFSFSSAFAGTLGINTFPDMGLKEFYQQRSFKDVYQSVIPTSEMSPAITKLVGKVGDELMAEFNKTLSEGNAAPIDFDSCSGKCLDGTSEFRMKVTMNTRVDLISKDTRACQKVCKAYLLESYAYINGMVYVQNHKMANSDCSEATDSTGRSHVKTKNLDAIINHVESTAVQK